MHGITTYANDPMYDVKRWFYWHSPIGTSIGFGISPAEINEERRKWDEEVNRDKRGLMERFSAKVCATLYDAAMTLPKEKLAERRKLLNIALKYYKREEYYRERHM